MTPPNSSLVNWDIVNKMQGAKVKTDSANSKSENAVVEDSIHRCSICNIEFKRSQTKTMPFCSLQCQQLDLRNWLDESYGFPFESERNAEYDEIHGSDESDLD